MAWFKRSAPGQPSRPEAAKGGLTGLGPMAGQPAAVAASVASSMQPVMASFVELSAELGEHQRVLTVGDDAVYPIAPALADQIVALDLGARQAVIISVAAADPAHAQTLMQQVRQLAARLKAEGYTIASQRLATREAIVDVLRHPGQRASSSTSGPLALFLGWIDLAEANGATDVHVEIRGNTAMVRVRVDGSLEPLADGVLGRYSAKEAHDAIAAGYNCTRKGSNAPTYEEDKFLDCMIGFNTARASGQLRFQNVRGRLGPKAVIRLLRQDRIADRTAAAGIGGAGGQP